MTLENYIYIPLFAIYGLIIGSFLNVCIYRIPKKISVAKGRSICPSCNHTLNALDLIPVISYLLLGRKCRYCKEKISLRYALIELLTAFLFVTVYLSFGFTFNAVISCLLTCVLIVVAFIDLDTKEIPDRLNISIGILGLINLFLSDTPIYIKLIGLVSVSLPLFIIAYFTGGFGGGDIKLMAAAGLYLGTYSVILAFFLGAFLSLFYCIYIMVIKKANRKTKIAFGPYLCLGIFISMLYGELIIDFYLSLIL